MKKILFFTFTITLLLAGIANTVAQDKEKERQEQFQKTVDMVEEGDFIFTAQRAFPQGGRSVDLTTNYGFIEISENTAKARLPFFGRAYSIPYGGNGGIKFSGEMEKVEFSRDQEKMRINYSFEIKDRDYYKVLINIGYDGSASVSITSNNRSHISYQGNITGTADSP